MFDDILAILGTGENEHVEFKQSFTKDAIESIVALANHEGGHIFVGVKDDGRVVGLKLVSETIPTYINQIKLSTEPSIIVDITSVDIDFKTILAIKVDEFPVKPVSFRGRYFKRIGNSNHQLTPIQIANMYLQSLQLSWDSYPANNLTIYDLDNLKIEQFMARVNESGRFKLNGTNVEKLEKLNLLKSGKPTNAAKLLFEKEPKDYSIHIGRFKTPSSIIGDKIIKNTLFEAVEETMQYLISWLRVAFEFTGKIERNEIFDYPLSALRELVLNAVVHRDYTSPVDIQIKIFDQAITLFNPGKLYGDLTIEKLKTDDYQSRARNKLIAEAFYLTKDIEKYGSGYIRVREAIRQYPTMEFLYEEIGDGYLVTIKYQEQKITTTPQATSQATPQATPQAVNNELLVNKTISEVLQLCIEPLSIKDLSKHTGLNYDYLKKEVVKPLLQSGLLIYTIPKTPRHPHQKYVITDLGSEIVAGLTSSLNNE